MNLDKNVKEKDLRQRHTDMIFDLKMFTFLEPLLFSGLSFHILGLK